MVKHEQKHGTNSQKVDTQAILNQRQWQHDVYKYQTIPVTQIDQWGTRHKTTTTNQNMTHTLDDRRIRGIT